MITLREAMREIGWGKQELLKLAYAGDYRGIDSAIPQGDFDSMQLGYGIDDEAREAMFFATDCRGSYPVVVDLRKVIKGYILATIIAEAELVRALTEYRGMLPDCMMVAAKANNALLAEALKPTCED